MNTPDLMRGLRWRATFSVLLLRRLTVKLSRARQKLPGSSFTGSSGGGSLPVRVHADLAFDCDVLSWDQSFENAAFVRESLEAKKTSTLGVIFLPLFEYKSCSVD